MDLDLLLKNGVLRPELFIGVASSIYPRAILVNLSQAGRPGGAHYSGGRYGRGEVGEFVLIEGQLDLVLGRVSEVSLREAERRSVNPDFSGSETLEAVGRIQLLGSVAMDNLSVSAGVDSYPRLGDRVYAAPHEFIAAIPVLMEPDHQEGSGISLSIGKVNGRRDSPISLRPERLFGRHCAILGATGGGKSWTTAKMIEECIDHNSKIVLIDASAEYRGFEDPRVAHCHLGDPISKASDSVGVSLPPSSFLESDFVALFEPAGRVQGPKLKAAIRSLRLAALKPELAPSGFIEKINKPKRAVEDAEAEPEIAAKLDDPAQLFDPRQLVRQIEQECVYPEGFGAQRGQKDSTRWGGEDGNFSHCLSLVARINGVLTSPALECVFGTREVEILTDQMDVFFGEKEKRLLRICLSGISYEYNAREIVANVIGRNLLSRARNGQFAVSPTIVFVDEAHNFLGRRIGGEDYSARLDAFEIIAKEGRKYGLNICLASQRPRDITEGVLSQVGTMLVHRLTNDLDRSVIERACGQIDQDVSAFLPNLRPGEAVIIGTDFPIPLTINVDPPKARPISEGANFQAHWSGLSSSLDAESAL